MELQRFHSSPRFRAKYGMERRLASPQPVTTQTQRYPGVAFEAMASVPVTEVASTKAFDKVRSAELSQTACQPAGLAPPMRQRHGAMTMFSGLAVLPSTVSAMDTVPWPRKLCGKARLSWSSPT